MKSRRLRLLQLVHGYPPALGGVETSTRDLCERLVADYDVDVTVFTTNALTIANFKDSSLPTLPIEADEEQNGVKIKRFPVVTAWARVLGQMQRIAWHLKLPGNDRLRTWYNGPISPRMLRAVCSFEADVVCAASFPLNHMTYPFRRREPRPPVILVGAVHTNNSWGYDRRHLIRLVARSSATVAHTEHEREWLIERGAPPEKLRVIGHGIELNDFAAEPGMFRRAHGIPRDAFLVAYLGQQAGHKGIDTLIRVLPGLLERREDAWLLVAGARTPYSAELRRLAEGLPGHTRSRLLFVDDLTKADRAQVLADCDVFASPSAQESFGITTLEAWSQAKPVVVGDGPAQRSVVEDGVSGILVPHGHEGRLLEALDTLGADASLRARLGDAGRRRLQERYDHSAVVSQYYSLFIEAAEARANEALIST
ncbi:MAG: glycosyltransferase family 4 protein [Verrucomicrobia bacterium]|nr:glycosyltransferase family 4 protein [Verrucomicrobiota bacterium]